MNKGEKNIDQLFKDTFDSFEPAVSDKLWSKVSDNIGSNSIGTATSSLGTWHIVSIAVACGIAGASFAWAFQDYKSEDKDDQKTKNIQINKNSDLINKIPLKEVVFTENYPIDKQDPLVTEKESTSKNFEISIKDNQKESNSIKKSNQRSSIVNLFLTPKTKVLFNSDAIEITHKDQPAETQVEITEVIKSKLNPVINSSASGGYVPLVVSFQQTENAKEVVWDFGDGTILSGSYVEHIFREAKDYTVKVSIEDEDGRKAMATKIVSLKTRCIISNVPNVFTPNGDGENDFFYVQGENIKAFFIQIFNIEGKVVFETNYIGAKWDGTDAAGQQLPNGQYLYFVKAIGEDGTDLSRTGTLTLKR